MENCVGQVLQNVGSIWLSNAPSSDDVADGGTMKPYTSRCGLEAEQLNHFLTKRPYDLNLRNTRHGP